MQATLEVCSRHTTEQLATPASTYVTFAFAPLLHWLHQLCNIFLLLHCLGTSNEQLWRTTWQSLLVHHSANNFPAPTLTSDQLVRKSLLQEWQHLRVLLG